ncbi:hypothetical protein [Burkholderia ubonensis]|nr:hypothetical protein [Burkholderia ubonensis]
MNEDQAMSNIDFSARLLKQESMPPQLPAHAYFSEALLDLEILIRNSWS